jgi:WD40 repeat protein
LLTQDNAARDERPFIGLRPFEYDDRKYFFGREKELEVLEPQVTQKSFVAIVGSSGSGKSSLIRAGLRPRLEKAKDRWSWIEMRPANAPVRRLGLALADLTHKTADRTDKLVDLASKTGDLLQARADRIERVLTRSSLGLVEALKSIRQQSEVGRVLLLVDQFEELFRFAKLRSESSLDPATAAERWDEATAFVRLLLAATRSSDVPMHVVVTMRSDFIGDCALFHGLPEAVSQSQFLVPGMTRDQREDVIRQPLKLVGGQIDSDLVQCALNDTDDEPDQLPILQHAMMRCWERAFQRLKQEVDHRPHLRIEDYTAVGGVDKALSVHANKILKALTSQTDSTTIDLQVATKRVFQALTATDQEGRSVRRPQRFGDLVQYVTPGEADESSAEKGTKSAAKKATREVVACFASHDCSFLRVILASDANDSSVVNTDSNFDIADNSIIDIGHEALIRRWDKLKGEGKENWINEEERDAEQYRALVRYADAKATIPQEDLTRVEDWWSKRKPNRFWAQRYTRHGAAIFEKIREVLARSRAEANRAIEEQRRNESRIIAIMANAIQNPRRYNGAADSLAMALSNKRPDLPNVTEYIQLLYNGIGELREKRRIHSPGKHIFALSFAPSGKLLAAAVPSNLLFFDTDTGKLVHSEKTRGGWVLSLRWSPDGKRIYVGTTPIGCIIAVCSIKKLGKYFTDRGKYKSVDVGSDVHPAGAGAWSYDSKWIVVAGWQRRASIWDAAKGRFKRSIADKRLERNPLDYMFSDIAASADGKRIALGAASGKIHIFSARSMGKDGLFLKLEKSLDPIDKNTKLLPYSLAFDPRNRDQLVAAYMPSSDMALWKIDENDHSTFGDEEAGSVWRTAFDPAGKLVACATSDAVVRLWPLPDPDPDSAVQLRGHLGSVFAVDISPENGIVASASFDGTIRLWVKDSPLSPTLLPSSASMPAPNVFSVQNDQISVTAEDGRNRSGRLPEKFSKISAAAVSANGAGIAVVPRFGRPALLVNLSDQGITATVILRGVKTKWIAVAFIESDTCIAAKTKDGKIFTWPFYSDIRSLEQLAKEHLPLVRDKNGSEKRLSGPRLAEAQIGGPAYSARRYVHDEYIVPFQREGEVENAKSLNATSESRQRSIKWLANNLQIIDLNDTALRNFSLDRIQMVPQSSFTRANLENGSFEETVLRDAKFMYATITRLNFAKANLQGARFNEAVVSKTSFEGADLKFARFDGARLLSEVNFSQADLNGTSFRNVTYDSLPNFDKTAWWLASGWNLNQVAGFVKKFGGADPERRRVVGEYPMFDRDLNRFESMLKKTSINTLQRAVALDGKAWTLAIHGIDLEEAERVSRGMLKTLKISRLSNEDKAKPLSYISDTLAYILLQKRRAEEAREVKKEDYGVQDPGGIFRHALALYTLGNEKEASDILKGSEQVKSYSPSHELYLLYNYLVGSGSGFMEIFGDVAK